MFSWRPFAINLAPFAVKNLNAENTKDLAKNAKSLFPCFLAALCDKLSALCGESLNAENTKVSAKNAKATITLIFFGGSLL